MELLRCILAAGLVFVAAAQDASTATLEIEVTCLHKSLWTKNTALGSICEDPTLKVTNPTDAMADISFTMASGQACDGAGTDNVPLTALPTGLSADANAFTLIPLMNVMTPDAPYCGRVCVQIDVTLHASNPMDASTVLEIDGLCGLGLGIDTAVDLNAHYEIEYGQPITELKKVGETNFVFPSTIMVSNDNNNEQLPEFEDKHLYQSVVALFRLDTFNETDAFSWVYDRCMPMEPFNEGPSPDDNTVNDEAQDTSSARRKKRSYRKKRQTFDSGTVVAQWFNDIFAVPKIPRCAHNLMDEFDAVLEMGDLLIDNANINNPNMDAVDVDISSVRMASKTPICFPGESVNGQIIFLADALGINTDTNLCNNAIRLNVTVKCPADFVPPPPRVIVDPVSNGQLARIEINQYESVYYDGSNFYQHYEYYNYFSCQEVYKRVIGDQLAAWQILANRISEANPACADATQHEANQQRLFASSLEQEMTLTGLDIPNGFFSADPLLDATGFMAELGNLQLTDKEYNELKDLYCFMDILRQVSVLEDSVKGEIDALLGRVENSAANRPEAMSATEFVENLHCEMYDGFSFDYYMLKDKLQELASNAAGSEGDLLYKAHDQIILRIIREKSMEYEADKLPYLKQRYGVEPQGCPTGAGARSKFGSKSLTDQYLELLKRSLWSEQQTDAPQTFPDDDQCGDRLLQVLIQEVGQSVFRQFDGMRDFMRVMSDGTRKNFYVEFMQKLKEIMDGNADQDAAAIRSMIEEEMRQLRDDTLSQCQGNVKSDDSFGRRLRMEGEVLWEGTYNPISASFTGAEAGSLVWRPVMKVFCEDCLGFDGQGENWEDDESAAGSDSTAAGEKKRKRRK